MQYVMDGSWRFIANNQYWYYGYSIQHKLRPSNGIWIQCQAPHSCSQIEENDLWSSSLWWSCFELQPTILEYVAFATPGVGSNRLLQGNWKTMTNSKHVDCLFNRLDNTDYSTILGILVGSRSDCKLVPSRLCSRSR